MNGALLPLALPAAAAAAILVARRRPLLRDVCAVSGALALAGCVLSLLPGVLAGEPMPGFRIVSVAPGLDLALEVEPLGLVYALVASLLSVPTALYSIGYARATGLRHPARFLAGFQLTMVAAVGIAFSANLFTLFVFYELMTLVTYPLVVHAGTERARAGGRRYLAFLLGTSLSLLFVAIAWTWTLAGSLDFREGGLLGDEVPAGVAALLLALYAWGFGKAALMPLHSWLPSAMVAPTPVSALLHAVAVVKAGVFALAKVVTSVFGLERLAAWGASDWLVIVASMGLVLAGCIALRQDELKLRLAYSTVSQLAYVTLGVALATRAGVQGATLQIVAHAAGKITLFFAAGCIQVATARTRVSQLDGIAARMPLTMACFVVGALSIIGLPPAAGMVAKWTLLQGAAEAGSWLALLALLLGTLLAFGYLAPIVHAAYFKPEQAIGLPPGRTEAPALMLLGIVLTALATLLLFALPGPAMRLAALVVGSLP